MNCEPIDSGTGSTRRSLLAATATGLLGATAGCVRGVRSVVTRSELEQLSVTIVTLPADGDRESIQLSRQLEANLEAVGIDASVDMRSREEFLRAILINHDFDCYVGRHPGGADPDFLYEALHSRFAEEAGWQNPFGYTNMAFDEHLERQREADDDERSEAVEEVLFELAREQPFTPVCVPTEYRVARTDHYEGWENDHLATRLGYLGLEPLTESAEERLRATVMDARPSENVNPISGEYREEDVIVDLLYDSIAAEDEGELVPWLATSWEWDGSTAHIELREDCTFHDGEPLTVEDVEFTYEFLADTTLGTASVPAPSPRYRGRASVVESIEFDDEEGSSLELTVDAAQAVGERAFTVPILPEHIWRDRAAAANVRGVQVAEGTTEAVVVDNVPAIGSGPFSFESRTERDHLTLERNDDHFTLRSDVDLPGPTVEQLRFVVDPRSASALSLVASADADVTATPLESYAVDEIPDADAVERLESPSLEFYVVGFNARRSPFGNPYFRRVLAGLLDKAWITEEIFEGHATPIASPLETPYASEWVPESLEWDGEDPEVPFFGSDGELDADAAREAFETIGYRYDDEGSLVVTD